MYVPFDSIPKSAKVWVYQSDKKLSEQEEDFILSKAKSFIDSWQSHGNDLKGSVKLVYNHFLILAIDESYNMTSGCSIDKSVHFIQQLEQELKTSLLNRSSQSYLINDTVQFFPVSQAKKWINEGHLSKQTLTFNNTVTSKEELDKKWLIPAEESWLNRFFK